MKLFWTCLQVFVMLLKQVIKIPTALRQALQISSSATAELLQNRRLMAPKHREDPVIQKLESPEFKSLFTEELKTLSALFNENGYEIRIAGGAVRDLLSGKQPKDLDFATTATPEQMKQMFDERKIRMINEKGEKHGTITPRINDKENFEVTTLRIDVTTNGRHAEVQYTTDWLLDANRRDLTINSMFLDLDGLVYDYFYGYDDLQKNRVAFVGNPAERIQEDYLRILRYFRFYGRIADKPNNHDDETITAIKENANGLAGISGERIWSELQKILIGNHAGELMIKILECGLASYIGLSETCDATKLEKVWKEGKESKLQAITLLSSLIDTQEHAIKLNDRLKLSVQERNLMFFIVEHRSEKPHEKPLQPYKELVLNAKTKFVRSYTIELLKYLNSPHLAEFEKWEPPRFPINGTMLKELDVPSGKIMGRVLEKLKDFWVENECNPSIEEILKQVPKVLETFKSK